MVNLDGILEEWRAYKMSVPTYGAVILNNCLDKVLLVQVSAFILISECELNTTDGGYTQ